MTENCNHNIGYLVKDFVICLSCDEQCSPNQYDKKVDYYLTITEFVDKEKGYRSKGYQLYQRK